MPASSKAQQRFFGIVRGIQKGSSKGSKAAKDVAKRMDKDDVEDYAKTKHKGLPNKVKREQRVRELIKKMVREIMAEDSLPTKVKDKYKKLKSKPESETGKDFEKHHTYHSGPHMKGKSAEDDTYDFDDPNDDKKGGLQKDKDKSKRGYEPVTETKKRDYKAEYKKFQSSTKSKKYRAELNKYNRQKGTYGNGDGKDASHKGGKIVGFEKESVNRGRAEKSRLKKEEKLKEVRIPFSSSHIKQLKRAFKDMKGSLPDNNPLVQKIVQLLKGQDKKVLQQLANADIKYLSDKAKDILGEGTCGYGENGELGEEPAGPHLIKKKIKEGKDTIFDVAAKVMKDSQMYNYKSKKGMVKVDMQTANLLTKVFKKVNPKMKKYLSKLGNDNPAQLVQTLWAVVK